MKFEVLLADPPWTHTTYSAKGRDRCADRHYPVITLADICEIGKPLKPLLAKDCALFLWVVRAHLEQGIAVGKAWGFQFSTIVFVWTKPKMGNGHWTRSDAEVCLGFLRGRLRRAAADVRMTIHAPATRHSEKPEEIYRRIERLKGDVPRLELFGRKLRPDWTVLGNAITGNSLEKDLQDLTASLVSQV